MCLRFADPAAALAADTDLNEPKVIQTLKRLILKAAIEGETHMKFDSILKNSHDLKKNGYRIFRKLHKMEKCQGAERAYAVAIDDTYFFLVGCRTLIDIIRIEYPDMDKFSEKCDAFLMYLEALALKKGKVDKTKLAGFLRSYTKFFNEIIDRKENNSKIRVRNI